MLFLIARSRCKVSLGVHRSCRNDGNSIPARNEDFPCPRRGLSSLQAGMHFLDLLSEAMGICDRKF